MDVEYLKMYYISLIGAREQWAFGPVTCRTPRSRLVGNRVVVDKHRRPLIPRERVLKGYCLVAFNQKRANRVTVTGWHTKRWPRITDASLAKFMVISWRPALRVLDGFSIEWREKKRQEFFLTGTWFGSGAMEIFWWKSPRFPPFLSIIYSSKRSCQKTPKTLKFAASPMRNDNTKTFR